MVLTSIQKYPSQGQAGQPCSLNYRARSFINNAKLIAGIYDLEITAANSHGYAFTVDGVPITDTSDGSATIAEVQALLIAALAANPYASVKLIGSISGTALRLTEINPSAGKVTVAEADADLGTPSVVTAHSDLEPMPAGIAVAKGTAGDQDLRLMRASGDDVVGVTVHQHQAIRGDDYPDGVKLWAPNSLVPVMYRGEIWVPVEEDVTPASPVYIRYAAGAGGTQLGAFRASADTATAVANTKMRYRSTALAGGLVRLALDLI